MQVFEEGAAFADGGHVRACWSGVAVGVGVRGLVRVWLEWGVRGEGGACVGSSGQWGCGLVAEVVCVARCVWCTGIWKKSW